MLEYIKFYKPNGSPRCCGGNENCEFCWSNIGYGEFHREFLFKNGKITRSKPHSNDNNYKKELNQVQDHELLKEYRILETEFRTMNAENIKKKGICGEWDEKLRELYDKTKDKEDILCEKNTKIMDNFITEVLLSKMDYFKNIKDKLPKPYYTENNDYKHKVRARDKNPKIFIAHCFNCKMLCMNIICDYNPCCFNFVTYVIDSIFYEGNIIKRIPLFTHSTIEWMINNKENIEFTFKQVDFKKPEEEYHANIFDQEFIIL